MMSSIVGLRPSYFVYAQDIKRDIVADSLVEENLLSIDSLAADSLSVVSDSILSDTIATDSIKPKKSNSGLDAVVNYQAKDSLIFSMGNMAYLFGESKVTYDAIELQAELINLSLDSSLVHANQ